MMAQTKSNRPTLLIVLVLALSVCMILPALFANVSFADNLFATPEGGNGTPPGFLTPDSAHYQPGKPPQYDEGSQPLPGRVD